MLRSAHQRECSQPIPSITHNECAGFWRKDRARQQQQPKTGSESCQDNWERLFKTCSAPHTRGSAASQYSLNNTHNKFAGFLRQDCPASSSSNPTRGGIERAVRIIGRFSRRINRSFNSRSAPHSRGAAGSQSSQYYF
jgi:hypothetical protein